MPPPAPGQGPPSPLPLPCRAEPWRGRYQLSHNTFSPYSAGLSHDIRQVGIYFHIRVAPPTRLLVYFSLELLKLIESNNIYHKVLINTLQSEIDELNMQITYHKNYIADILMYGCCSECCKNKKFSWYYINVQKFYKWTYKNTWPKKHILICILNIVNKSEKNTFQYLKTTVRKDAIVYTIEHLVANIDRVTKDIKSEKQNKK